MGKFSRDKGARAERHIVTTFSEWYLDDAFARRGSGFKGYDLICPKWFPYTVEVKDVADIRTKHFFNPTALLLSFWDQTKEQTAEGRLPLLCIKVEGQWLVVREDFTGGEPGLVGHWGDRPAVLIERLTDFLDQTRSLRREPQGAKKARDSKTEVQSGASAKVGQGLPAPRGVDTQPLRQIADTRRICRYLPTFRGIGRGLGASIATATTNGAADRSNTLSFSRKPLTA